MIGKYIRRYFMKRKWRKLNPHNSTVVFDDMDITKVSVGIGTYGGIRALTHNTENSLSIGNYCSIGPNVMFVVSADHALNHISTYPFKAKMLDTTGNVHEAISKGDIVVDDDVWIGYGVTILSGVHIGQGAVIAAGAIVTNDIPPYAVVAGVPAKVLKYRFNDEIISELLKVDFSKIDRELVSGNVDELYSELTDVDQLHWLPKK